MTISDKDREALQFAFSAHVVDRMMEGKEPTAATLTEVVIQEGWAPRPKGDREPIFSSDPVEELNLRMETLRAAQTVAEGGEAGSVSVVMGHLLAMYEDMFKVLDATVWDAPRPRVSREKLHQQIGGSIGLGEPPALLVGRVIDILRQCGIEVD